MDGRWDRKCCERVWMEKLNQWPLFGHFAPVNHNINYGCHSWWHFLLQCNKVHDRLLWTVMDVANAVQFAFTGHRLGDGCKWILPFTHPCHSMSLVVDVDGTGSGIGDGDVVPSPALLQSLCLTTLITFILMIDLALRVQVHYLVRLLGRLCLH